MAIESIPITDFNGLSKKVAADLFNSDEYAQVLKVGYGGDGITPTLVDTTAPLPTKEAKGSTWTSTVIAVATTSTAVITADTSRVKFALYNDSDQPIRVGPTSSVAMTGANRGWPIQPGGWFQDDRYTGDVYAIHGDTGTKDLLVYDLT